MNPTAVKTASRSITRLRKAGHLPRPKLKDLPTFERVAVEENYVHFDLNDGRIVLMPLVWSALLTNATSEQRQAFKVSPWNVFWDELDEIIGVENLLYGRTLWL